MLRPPGRWELAGLPAVSILEYLFGKWAKNIGFRHILWWLLGEIPDVDLRRFGKIVVALLEALCYNKVSML